MRLPIRFVLQSDHASKIYGRKTSSGMGRAAVLALSAATIIPAAMISPVSLSPASALVGAAPSALPQQLKQDSSIVQVYVRRGAVAGPGVRHGRWVRPANYYWRPGGAIAAGAAIGFVTAATAAAWAGAPPGPGYCWYYTDPSRTQGFWDVCQ
jgi:hypothetical protein